MSLVYGDPEPPLVVPTVLAPRLKLTGWTAADLDAYLAMAVHPAMSRWTSSPGDAGSVWRMFTYQVGHWALRGYGMWLAHERDTGEFVGRVGLYEEHGWPGLEVAWTIRRDRWGLGYATEGGRAALEYAFTVVGRDRVISIIHPDNTPSVRVAEKLGLVPAEQFTRPDGEPRSIYAISRETWEQQPRARRIAADESAATVDSDPL